MGFLTAGCKRNTFIYLSGQTQGTYYSIIYQDDSMRDFSSEIDSLLKELDMSFSVYQDSSLLASFNRGDSIVVDKHIFFLIKKAFFYWRLTGGIFDPTIKPVMEKLGFYGEKLKKGPGNYTGSPPIGLENIALIDRHTGKDVSENKEVLWESGRYILVKKRNGIQLDLDAITQGYSVDYIASFLERQGIENYKVEIGGEVRCKGKNPHGEIWGIGIIKPFRPGGIIRAVWLRNTSISTSGTYTKFIQKGDTILTHFISPKTGRPVKTSLVSVSIISRECVDADALATIGMLLGEHTTGFYDSLKKHLDFDYYIIFEDGREEMSWHFREMSYE